MLALISCKKKDKWDSSQTYTVEGYFVSTRTHQPVQDISIALSQSKQTYNVNDPYCTLDSNGHFSITYTPSGNEDGVSLYPRHASYNCVFTSIDILDGIPKGQNVSLGKIYTTSFN